MDVLNKECIMSDKEQGVGLGILEYFLVTKVFLILGLLSGLHHADLFAWNEGIVYILPMYISRLMRVSEC